MWLIGFDPLSSSCFGGASAIVGFIARVVAADLISEL